MRKLRTVPLLRLLEDSVLAARSTGESHFPRLLPQMEPPGALMMDFDGIEALTTSYFFAALWPFWTREDATGPSVFPLIANANPGVEEEISFAMQHRRMATWRGRFDGGCFDSDGWLGLLDEGLDLALKQAATGHGLSAVELSKLDGAKPTAWNNRLASAHRQRLLRREQVGRRNTYYAPWKVLDDG